MTERLRVGTRGSPLALAQTEEALALLRMAHPQIAFETVAIRTHGDEGHPENPDTSMDGKRSFTKRIEDALLGGTIDFAVHSLKDVPTELVPGLEIAAVPTRADPRDALVANGGLSLGEMPEGTRVGTSSLRRRAQLKAEWPGLRLVDLHGNVGTRLQRLGTGDIDAVVVAAAGLGRLGLGDRRPQPIAPELLTPAPGQGALALESRAADTQIHSILQAIEDPVARRTTDAERAVSALLGGGCNVPFGALATIVDGSLRIRAVVASPDGQRIVRALAQAPVDAWRTAVDGAASRLLHGGADEILREAS